MSVEEFNEEMKRKYFVDRFAYIQDIMDLMKLKGSHYIKDGDLEIQLNPSFGTLPQTTHDNDSQKISDEDILMNPYAGMDGVDQNGSEEGQT